jgi:hypothetical protein
MSRILILLVAFIAGCAGPKVKDYTFTESPNAVVKYKSEGQAPFIKIASLNIFAARGCDWEQLGVLKVKEGEHLYLPPETFLQIDVHLGNISAISPYAEHSTLFYRFHSTVSGNYLLEINNGARSHGFQVYSLDAKGDRREIPYESLAKDCRN